MRTALATLVFILAAGAVEAIEEAPSALRQWTKAIAVTIHGRMNPAAAAGTGGGTVVVRFTVLRSGIVTTAELARSSGVSRIDNAALSAVRGSLPAAPAEVTQPSLSVTMPLNYRVRAEASGSSPKLGTADGESPPIASSQSAKLPMPDECKWSKANRTDQTLRCPQDDVALRPAPVVQPIDNLSQIPNYDMDTKCASTGTRAAVNECLERNQSSYDYLKLVWASISTKNKERCDKMAASTAWAYYTLRDCVTMFEEADRQMEKNTRAPPAFRY